MKPSTVLTFIFGAWVLSNIVLYNFVVNHAPRADAVCRTFVDGRLTSTRSCSKEVYNLGIIFLAEAMTLGFTAFFFVRKMKGNDFQLKTASASLLLGLESMPFFFLFGVGVPIALLSAMMGIQSLRGSSPGKWKAVVGIIASLVTLGLFALWCYEVIPHGGLRMVIIYLRLIPLPR